jgi:uncharacterized protein YjbJ (UPF0337 family)
MDSDVLKGKWNQITGEVKSRWGKLTDDDLLEAEGDREKLAGKITERYGLAKDEARAEVDKFLSEV